jgi:hypothetical protein
MSLVLFWTTPTTSTTLVTGQSHALRLSFVPARDSGIETHVASKTPWKAQPECPLTVTLEYNDRVEHNFANHLQCTSTILFRLKNISPDLVCDFTLELLPPTSSFKEVTSPTPNSSQQMNSFLWSGTTKVQAKGVLPGQLLHVPVKVCFFAPGQFNLNQFKVNYISRDEKNPDERATLKAMAFSDMQYMLSVQDNATATNA